MCVLRLSKVMLGSGWAATQSVDLGVPERARRDHQQCQTAHFLFGRRLIKYAHPNLEKKQQQKKYISLLL